MIRKPLRPLAHILAARQQGENPDTIERENRRLRHEEARDRARSRAEGRLLLLAGMFFLAFATVGLRMGLLSASEAAEPRTYAAGNSIVAQRADIVDRNGRILATNLSTFSLYAQPPNMIDKPGAAKKLAAIFPDLKEDELLADFTGKRKFLWIKKKLSPEQKQAVHDIGDPGLLFGPREMRLYPNGTLAAHILGGTRFEREGVHSAELVGVAGVEKAMDAVLRDPARDGAPLQLSIDLTVQNAMRDVLGNGMKLMNAKGAAGILMDVHTGEILSMVSLPDFDPNDRPRPLTKGEAADSPLFNRAVQGVYELGSTFKIFTVAQAMELGLVSPDTMVDANAPMRWGRFTIKEFQNKNYGPLLSVSDVIVKSSNVGTAKLALQIGGARQKAFLESFGVFDPLPVELVEAPGAKPLVPPKWSEIVTITASYGHGFSASPLHLASAYASLLNGGTLVRPTLLRTDRQVVGPRIVSPAVSAASAQMLRDVVLHGTATFGAVPGYEVGGKTGTANKVRPDGRGYLKDKNINTFAAVFPSSAPRYVIVVSLDEASDNTGSEPRRTAGWTAVPVTSAIVTRVAPLLGLAPAVETSQPDALTLTSN
ncbi:Cell division protein FtsI/penicillin-binding protein 2 [Oceaniovalibus guishaninsula JLT2003]|uniref:Cell division protein FtsI/penicillin-binding protein 2 n=1 Tax=Oceaniovalibus guishaninsula JLT2003 TaxID=1231392 RepID=K2HRF0_9RHOB|nr:penicillin-binding protein 2 [Oceaniovalibus guishaninsula]EKE45334.1 Cell division protein FtsI/penicillin-binding protein 2 [Oceaniovalibus guishaninsula JLT2003]